MPDINKISEKISEIFIINEISVIMHVNFERNSKRNERNSLAYEGKACYIRARKGKSQRGGLP